MQIRMLATWAYDVVPGQIRRTLPAGQIFDEPMEIAQAAIDAGAAERIVAMAPIADDVAPAEVDPDLDGDRDDDRDGDDQAGDQPGAGDNPGADDGQPLRDPQVASPAPVAPGRSRKTAPVVPAPADPVEPA